MDKLAEVKKYLIVGLSNLLISSKKSEESKKSDESKKDDTEMHRYDEENKKNILKSRLDLLFARFNLITEKYPDAIDKLTSSIIAYSEIYGPESVGLTQHYYYLANYFYEKKFEHNEKQEKREVIIKNIYLKMADIWRRYFMGEKNPLFESTVFFLI